MQFMLALISLVVPLYLDPGSGSTLLQLLIAGLLGSLFLIKLYWKKVISIFNRSQSNPDKNPSDDENNHSQTDQ